VIEWEVPGPYRVAFTTRRGGVSTGPYASLNLARSSGDVAERVAENRRRACGAVEADAELLALTRQRHTATVREARAGARSATGDGSWTAESGLPILALAADCVPIVLARADGRPTLAVLHAGWRGLLAGIVDAGAAALGGSGIVAALGPSIGPCCYEVGSDVAEPFQVRFGKSVVSGGRLDLWASAERALRLAGVSRVERLAVCTACHPGLFFSHRRDGAVHGAQGVIGVVC